MKRGPVLIEGNISCRSNWNGGQHWF